MPPKTAPLPKLRSNLLSLAHKPSSIPNTTNHNSASENAPTLRSRFAFPSLLKSCTALLDLSHGKRIHASLLQMGLQSDPYIASSLITMYARCGTITDAAHVFDGILHRDSTLWNAMLAGYFHHGFRSKGFSLFQQMQSLGVSPDGHSLSIVLGSCSDDERADLELVKQAHAYIVANAFDGDPFLATALIDKYTKCGGVMEAYRVFVAVDEKNVFVWNTMIAGFCQNGSWEKSLELFALMRSEGPELQPATFSSVLMACCAGGAPGFGEGIHCCVIKLGFELDPYVCTSLLAMYARCISIDGACRVFDGVPSKRIELWNSMISAFVANGYAYGALDLYKNMRLIGVRCDHVTILNVLSACGLLCLLDFGRMVHGKLIKRPELGSLVAQSSLMTMYMKCGSIEDAESLFSSITQRDVVIWGSMISGFCQNKKFDRALGLFNRLRAEGSKPDSTVIASAVSACAGFECLQLGLQIHGLAIKSGMSSDVFVGSALIDMYAKCGVPKSVESVLFDMPYTNLAVWNSIISGYGHNGLLDQSIRAFAWIYQHGLVPDSISVTSVLASVSSLAALTKGKMIHGYQLRSGLRCDVHAENALLDMYVKCGCLIYAKRLFDRMSLTNVVAWNTMIAGFGSHGHCMEAITLFDELWRSEVLPDDITFLSLISSCSHSGMVEEGLAFFETMNRDYGIGPRMEHYANVVDLLGRAGRLDEAYRFIEDMPVRSDETVWLCLLSACRAHRVIGLGEVVANQLLKLMPEGSGSYTQLLNFYGEIGELNKVASLKSQMREAGVMKNPGCSWIEVKDRVEVFYSGDSSSPRTREIHDILRDLKRTMRRVDDFL